MITAILASGGVWVISVGSLALITWMESLVQDQERRGEVV